MQHNPYIGPRPYTREDQANFYGRARETRDLLSLILAERLVLFYAQSGAGKTSLLNARVLPALEAENFHILPIARVSNELPAGMTHEAVGNIFVFSALQSIATELSTSPIHQGELAQTTIKAFFETLYPRQEDALPPMLVFDQFEEIFTTHRHRWQDALGFFEQLRDALDTIPDLGIVLSMREDFIAELDAYAPIMPRRIRARFRMLPLSPKGALDAITRPALNAGCAFEPGAAEWLVENLRHIKVQHPVPLFEGQELPLGPVVEPVQLQVVCYRLWENLPEQEDREIQLEELQQYGDIDRALIEFYESALETALQTAGFPEHKLRRWFNEQLVTALGTRGLVLRGEAETVGVPNDVVDVLSQHNLIRSESRAGARWHELAHDRLIDPVLQANEEWDKARQAEQPWRALAHRWTQMESPSLLIREETLAQAVTWAARHADEIEAYEQDFLQASQRAEYRRKRNRVLTITGGVLAIVIIVLVSYLASRAERARKIAHARQLAAQSQLNVNKDLGLATLLSVEAIQVMDTVNHPRIEDRLEVLESLPLALSGKPQLQTFLYGHDAGIRTLAVSPDAILASGDRDGTIRFWDITRYRARGFPLAAHSDQVRSLAFSPDGAILASGGAEGSIYLWDMKTQHVLEPPLIENGKRVLTLAFSPDGSLLASGGADSAVTLWDIATHQPLGEPLTGHPDWVYGVAFSPDGKTVASIACAELDDQYNCHAGEVRLWDVAGRQLIGAPLRGHTNYVTTIAFSPDGRTVATGGWDQTVILWDTVTQQPINPPLTGHNGYISSLVFNADGSTLASGSRDTTIILWNVSTHKAEATLVAHQGAIESLTFAPDGHTLFSAGDDQTIIVWDTVKRQTLGEPLVGHQQVVESIAVSSDSRWLATGSCVPDPANGEFCMQGEIRLWDVATRQEIAAPLRGQTDLVDVLAFAPDGSGLAAGNKDGTLQLWDVSQSTPQGDPVFVHAEGISGLAFSPDGTLLAVGAGHNEGAVSLWNPATGQPVETLVAEGIFGVLSVAFSPDGRLLATGGCAALADGLCSQGEIRWWNVETRELVTVTHAHEGWIYSLTFSPNGKWLASGGYDKQIRLWDTKNYTQIDPPFTGHNGWVTGVDFSADSKNLASSSEDGTVIIWDVESRAYYGVPLAGHTDKVNGVVYGTGSEGQLLVISVSDDHTGMVWDIDLDSWITRACDLANRNLTMSEWIQFVDTRPGSYKSICPSLSPGSIDMGGK
ncbi:MAG: hypothetical protein JXA33_09370 [Anaerolineae bacterium]|nr:hypothetical protein [Anaerolineae bacterium]